MSAATALKAFKSRELTTYLRSLLKARGLNQYQLAEAVYGRNEQGRPRNSGYVSQIIQGKSTMSKKTADRWGKALGVSGSELVSKLAEDDAPALTPKLGRPPLGRARPFSLSVHDDGTADVTLTLSRVPLDVALKVLHLLEVPGVLPGARLAITHDRKQT